MIRRIINNVGTNLAQLFINIIVTFVMAPIYLKMMGHYDYGIREFVMVVAGYMGLLMFGMQPTIGRYVSMHTAEQDRKALLSVYISSMVFMLAIGSVVAIIFWVWGLFWPDTLGEGSGDALKYRAFLFLVGLQLLFVFPMYVTASVLEGLQRFYIKNFVNIMFTVSIATVCYFFMNSANALLLLVSLTTAGAGLKLFIFYFILSKPSFGSLRLNFSYFSFFKLKEMLWFGFKSFVQGVSSHVNNFSDKLVIGSLMGPAALPLYSIPRTLLDYVNNTIVTITRVFMPLFSDLNTRGRVVQLQQIYLMVSKYTVALVLAMSVGIGVIGSPFIEIWMPGEFDSKKVNGIVIVLATYMSFHRLNPLAGNFLHAVNRHGFLARIMPVGAVINLVVSIWLVLKIGVLGAALGTLIPALFLAPTVLLYCCRSLGIPVWDYVRLSIFPAFLPVSAMSALIVWMRIDWGLTTYFRIGICVISGAIVFIAVFFLVSCGKEELALWKRHLRAKF